LKIKHEKELPGKKFGKLTVKAFHHRARHAYFLCECGCGNTKAIIRGASLLRNDSTTCGRCQEFELIDKKFGKLTVKAFHHRNKKSQAYFLCECDCGNTGAVIQGGHLVDGNSTRCRICGNTRIGRNEHEILDKIAEQKNIKIEHNVPIEWPGYYFEVDGYDRANNVVYEVYEKFHDKQIPQDLTREELITKHLGCDFVIIHDRTH
jgi:hypothetical protein